MTSIHVYCVPVALEDTTAYQAYVWRRTRNAYAVPLVDNALRAAANDTERLYILSYCYGVVNHQAESAAAIRTQLLSPEQARKARLFWNADGLGEWDHLDTMPADSPAFAELRENPAWDCTLLDVDPI